jgi:serine phosphatase RsbU (regulator of sigma subunit)
MNRGESFRFFLFFLILFGGFFLGFEFYLEAKSDQAWEEYVDSAVSETQTVAVQNEPDLFIRQRVLPFLKRGSGFGRIALAHACEVFQKTWGIPVSFFRFDRQGNLLEKAPHDAPQVWLLKNLYKGLHLSSGSGLDAIQKQITKKIQFVFGDDKDLETIKSKKGRIIEVFAGGQEGFLAWNSTRHGGLIAYCARLPDEVTVFNHQEVRVRSLKSFAGKRLAAGFGHQGGGQFVSTRETDDRQAAEAYAFLRDKKQSAGAFQGFWWVFQETHSGRIWFGMFPPFAKPFLYLRGGLMLAGAGTCVFMGWLLFSTPMISRFSLKHLLLGLFLTSAVVPLVGVAIGSVGLVGVYENRVGMQIGVTQHAMLQDFAGGFEGFLIESAGKISRILENPGSGRDALRNAEMERGLKRRGFLSSFFLRDVAGNLLHSNVPMYSADRETLNRSVAREAVERHCPQRKAELPYKGNIMTDKLVKANDMGIVEILENPKVLADIVLGNTPLLFYFQVYPELVGGPGVAEIRQPLLEGVTNYLRRKGRDRRATRFSGQTVYALNLETLDWTIAPPPFLKTRFRNLAFRSMISKQAQAMRFCAGFHRGFALSIHFPKLAEHCLVAVTSDSFLVREIRTRWEYCFSGAVLLAACLMLLSRHVSAGLLLPLASLGDGAAALIARDFRFRLPGGNSGEMDRLFRGFNEMMNDTFDLQMAKQVQERMLPIEFPQIEGYSLFGKIFMASNLGGDCLNCNRLDDGRILFLIGDISGHGMASALLMAFSRAITFHASRQGHTSPSSLATQLDMALRRRHGGKEFLGAICGILDPVSHAIEFTVQGHIFPLFLKPDGSGEWVGKPNLPLGRGKPGRTFTCLRRELVPGEVFLGITDGFVEAKDETGEMIGFGRVATWLHETRSSKPEEWVATMMKRHAGWSGGHQDDDITILIVERRGW